MEEEAGGEAEGEEEGEEGEEEPKPGGYGEDDAVDEAGFGGLEEGFPEEGHDEAGDGGGEVVNQAEEDLPAGDFLEEDGEEDGGEEGQEDDPGGVAGGGPEGAPPVGVEEEVGKVVEAHEGGGAEDVVVEEGHEGALEEGDVGPDEDGEGGGEEEQKRHGRFCK